MSEIERLMRVFDVFDEDSELRRYGEGNPVSPELGEVLALADVWKERTGGAFSPATDQLRQLWRRAEAAHQLPIEAELAAAVEIAATGPADNLNALAKGWIVDRAVEQAMSTRFAPKTVVVEAGGDLVHVGAGHERVGIENPLRPYDNEPPIDVVSLTNQALATSGSARRFFEIDGQRFSHVLDPRIGWPVSEVISATIVAKDAAMADVLATAVTVLGQRDGLALVEDSVGASGLVVDETGEVHTTSGWPGRN